MKKEEKILFWSERVQEFYSSGQTCRTWCQEHQVPVSTMSYWIRKLKNVDPVSVKEDAPVFAKLPTEQEFRRKEPVSLQVCDVASSAYLPHSGKSRLGCEAGTVMKFVFIPFVYCWRAGT